MNLKHNKFLIKNAKNHKKATKQNQIYLKKFTRQLKLKMTSRNSARLITIHDEFD